MKMMQAILAGVLCLATVSGNAQFGAGMGGGPNKGLNLSGSTAKLFGENKAFTASMELQANSPQGPVTVPGKVSFMDGKARFEMNMMEVKSAALPAGAADQMKAMGLEKIIMISLPEKKMSYAIYPGMQAYLEMPMEDSDAAKPDSDFKLETTELAKETLDGHACVKNKAVVTDKEGNKHESTTWNAGDLNKFPVKIEQTVDGSLSTMTFKDVKLSKPDAKDFNTPTDYKKYDNMMAMMQEMMKKAGAAGGPAK